MVCLDGDGAHGRADDAAAFGGTDTRSGQTEVAGFGVAAPKGRAARRLEE